MNTQSEDKTDFYEPNAKGVAILTRVKNAYDFGVKKLDTKIPAFSNRTAHEIYQHSLNSYNMVREEVDNMTLNGWKANVKTATTRTKVAAIISSFIKQMMIPSVKAVEDSVPKEQRAKVARALLDYWRIKVKYDTKMREILIDAVASPYTLVELGYQEVFKNKRIWNSETEEFEVKQVVDDLLTNFYMNRLKFGQVLVSNIEEREVQKQEWIIKRSIHSYEYFQGIHGKKDNFEYVEAGSYFDADKMDYVNHPNDIVGGQVEEVIYYSRTRDEQITILNGVIVEDSPLSKKRVQSDYPFARIGSEPLVDEYSWFSFPLIMRLNEDQKLLDHLINMYIDGEHMNIYKPKAVNQDIGAESLIPGTQTVVDEKFEVTDLAGGGSGQLMSIISLFKGSVEEIAPGHMSGLKPEGEMSRRQWVDLSDNAFTSQGIFLAEYKDFVEDITRLALHDIMQNILVGAVDKIVGGETPASVIIRNGYEGDAAKDMQIMFSKVSDSNVDPLERSFEILKKEKETKTKIIELDPTVMFTTDFDIYVEPEVLKGNKEQDDFQRAQMGYQIFAQNPKVNLEFITKEFGKAIYKDKVTELLKSEEDIMAEQQQAQQMEAPKQLGGNDNTPKVETAAPVA